VTTKPPIPEIQAPEGWEREEEERTVASVSVGVFSFDCVSKGVVYKNVVDEGTRGFVFGSRVSFDPEPPRLAVRAILRAAKERIWKGVEEGFEERGLSSLRRVGSRNTEIGGSKAFLRRYTAETDGERSVVWIAVWPSSSYICVAGGAYPESEDMKDTVMRAVHSFK